MPASSMLALFVRTNCVSWRKQTWIVRLLCLSRSRNVIPLRLRLRFTGQLRQLFMFLVRLSSWRLQQRQGLAIQVLAGTETVSELARQHEVSRKFLYQQVHTAEKALSAAFAPSSRPDDVLFYLPVTKAWLRQLVLGLVFICHSSTRGVVELLRDLFDYPDLPGDRAQHRAQPRCSCPENQRAVRPLHHPHRPPR